MAGETSLPELLSSLEPVLSSTTFVFSHFADTNNLPRNLSLSSVQMAFHEKEGLTVILPRELAQELNLEYVYKCSMITLQIHSSLEAVGFLAHITTKLTEKGISVNPVSAFLHDHLFVPEEKVEEVMSVLYTIQNEAVGNKNFKG